MPIRARRTASFVLLALTAALAGCATNPVSGRREFSLVSADQELAIGREGYPATIEQYGVCEDASVRAYVDSVGQRVAHASDLPNLKWTFTVLDDPVVNAFAMPGGYIYITRGILAHLNSEAQLAGVLGHEIGHVTARHSAKQITQQQIAGLGLGLAAAFSSTVRAYGGAAQQALGLLMLKYSRDDETQADELGVKYATAAGYDPRQIPGTYATLKRIADRSGQSLPGFLSTHPDPGDREQRTRALAAQASAGKAGLVVRRVDYVSHLRGLVYGDDPRQGYFEDARFYAPEMGFEMTWPAGWTLANARASVSGQEPNKSAAGQLSLAADAGASAPDEYAAALLRDGKVAAAQGARETIGGWPAWVGRVALPPQNGVTTTLRVGFVRIGPSRMLEFLGQSPAAGDAFDARLLDALRSIRPIQDAARLRPVPARVRLARASSVGPFRTVIAALGTNGVEVDEASILNGVEPDEIVQNGEWLKLVDPARRR